ncbi:MAG: MBL fold metallo-hydrolase [Candidatus Methylomirabilales bacterium]
MKPTFQMQLVNGPWGDPVLYVRIRWARRGLLFDLGNLTSLPSGDLLRVSEVFVSHTHLDHFVGFDHLLRTVLGRDRILTLCGPPGIIGNVEGKLQGYTWNLVQGYPLCLEVFEVDRESIRGASFACAEAFQRRDLPSRPFTGEVWSEPGFRVGAAHLDHQIPCFAFALEEPFHINIDKERLARLKLPVGPWLTDLKAKIRAGISDDTRITVGGAGERGQTFSLSELKAALVHIAPGQKVAYVTDALYCPENVARIVTLAKGADVLYCEAAYLDRDESLAAERCHLTARQAGLIAREAAVRRLVLFHFSPRYQGDTEPFHREAREAFGEWVTVPKRNGD